MLDKAEEKAEFDRALEHSVQKAAVQKAVADKALLDMGEMEVSLPPWSLASCSYLRENAVHPCPRHV